MVMYKIDRRGSKNRILGNYPSDVFLISLQDGTVTSAPVKLVTNVIFRVIFSLSVLTNQIILTLYFNLDKF